VFATYDEDTIAAIATPAGEGGIGIIRLSGQCALAIADELFAGSRRQSLLAVPNFSLHHGYIVHPATGMTLDEVLVSVMRSPHSYTREDVVEINCHGGMLALQQVLEVVLARGARLATPGEFTKRAFLNGRIDLSQAESVLDVIRAKTDAGLQLAVQQLQGKLSKRVQAIRDHIAQLLAAIEASIDFADEDIEIISFAQIDDQIQSDLAAVEQLLAGAQEGTILREGLSMAIVGKPNVGKSSLLNVFLQEERAIVTPIPGTTRDTIEDVLNLNGIPIRLIDTAGLRETSDQVERLGVERSRRMIQHADMVLCVFDGSAPWSVEDEHFLNKVAHKEKFFILNKIDLPAQLTQEDLQAQLHEPVPIFRVSLTEQIGIDELKQAIVEKVISVPIESVAVTNVRHKHALTCAKSSLLHAQQSTQLAMSPEFIALDLREALNHLGEITGETTTDDILDRIFSTFCIGK
jgi:tRNA modification GTPase